MQTLNTKFSDYVRSTGYDAVSLYGPKRTKIQCVVLKERTKMGREKQNLELNESFSF